MDSGRTGNNNLTPERPIKPIDTAAAPFPFESVNPTCLNHKALVGTTLDERYLIQSLIGVGGMSAVYKAYHAAFDKTVAVKMLHQHLCTDRHSLDRFLREARTENTARHPNIVSVQSIGVTAEGRLFMVMDYLEGKSLEETINLGGPLPPQAARNIFVQICDALDCAHSMGVIHRDLKPSNIMLVGPNFGMVKIVDFGVAKLLVGSSAESQSATNGGVVGSPPYMSPEQCLGKSPDYSSDIYSLGCLMYEALTGKLPLMSDTSFGFICRQLNDTPAPFKIANPQVEVPADLEAIVFKCLEKVPEKRFNSALELKKALEKINLPETLAPTAAPPTAKAPGSKPADEVVRNCVTQKSGALGKKHAKVVAASLAGAAVIIATTLLAENFASIKSSLVIPVLQHELQTAQQQHGANSKEAMKTDLLIADEYFADGQAGKAKPFYRDAISALTSAPNTMALEDQRLAEIVIRATNGAAEQQQALYELGHAHARTGNIAAERHLLEMSVQVPNAMPHIAENALVELANLASDSRDYYAEQRYAEMGLKLTHSTAEITSPILLSFFYLKRAEADQYLGNVNAAIEWYGKALEIMPTNSRADLINHGEYSKRLAICNWRLGREADGCNSLRQSIAWYQKAIPPDLHEAAECYRGLADHFMQTGNFREAQSNYEDCLELATHLGPIEQLMVKENLAACYFQRHEFTRAETLYRGLVRQLAALPGVNQSHLASMKQRLQECRQPK